MFEWDDHNLEHIARHQVEPEEAEEALADARRVRIAAHNTPFERRQAVIGKTEDGRLLFLMFTKRGERFGVGTAREATPTERKKYRRR